ncbi:MAG: hypothetical protein KKD35_03350 [Elusimicrobia bacterium]|nr:hypothetical protein [Elusimicrobiota bacterium]
MKRFNFFILSCILAVFMVSGSFAGEDKSAQEVKYKQKTLFSIDSQVIHL